MRFSLLDLRRRGTETWSKSTLTGDRWRGWQTSGFLAHASKLVTVQEPCVQSGFKRPDGESSEIASEVEVNSEQASDAILLFLHTGAGFKADVVGR